MKNKHTLQAKLFIGYFIFAVAIIICISIAVGIRYWNEKMKDYSKLAYSYARTAVGMIDGDKVLNYVKTEEKDEYYQQIMDFLNATLKETDIKYYYVFVPYENDLVYVWDADIAEGSCPLGFHENYMEGGKESVEKIYKADPPEDISIVRDDTYGYIASAYSPIFNSSGEPVAVVGVDLSMPGLRKVLFRFVLTIIICIFLVTIISLWIFSVFVKRKIVRPIGILDEAARDMAGNLDKKDGFHADIHTGDEIEELADSFGLMDREVRDYIKRLAAVTSEKERIGAELNVAAQIQNDMLPRVFPAFPERSEFDIYAAMSPAKEVGGDFYDFFLVDDDHLALVMADVSGKGVPAALFMMIAKMLLKNAAQTGLSPKVVLERVNDQLCENNDVEMFVTVWIGILQISTGKMMCSNAGHEYPAICRAGGNFELYKDRHGLVLAGMKGSRYREYELCLQGGDSVFLYTDGVAEATNEVIEAYGTDRMLAALNSQNGINCEGLVENVRNDLQKFVGEAPQFDDVTMLAIRLTDTQTGRMQKISIKPELQNVETATAFFENILREHNAPAKVIAQVNISVDEIFSNIARYSGATSVTLGCEIDKNSITMRFSDNGRSYDPTDSTDPDITLDAEERTIGGLGIFMVKKIMDSVTYEFRNELNILTLKKNW